MADKLFSSQDYQKILDNRFKDPRIKYISAEVKPISEHVEGFMGDHFQLNITYELNGNRKMETLFLKSKPTGKFHNEFTSLMNVYEKEIFLYDFLFKEFQKQGYDTSFASQSYYCLPGKAIVMDNLTTNGFSLAERLKFYDMAHMKCLLKSLALFHGASLAYERKVLKGPFDGNDEFAAIFEEGFYCVHTNPDGAAMKFWKPSFEKFDIFVDLLPKKDKYKKEVKRKMKNYKVGKVFGEKTSFTKACGHGDLWSNNMMFKCEDGVPTQCCLVDFQICRYFYPAYDVASAIYFNTNAEFRSKHLTELQNYYYNTLSSILHNYGYSIDEILPVEEFHQTLKLVKVEALFQVFMTNTVIHIPAKTITDCVNSAENGFTKVIFDSNEDIMRNLYENNELFRNAVLENLTDIFDALNEVS